MKILVSYFKKHIKTLLLFILFALIFTSVFYLSNLPLDAVFYSFLLCFAAGIMFFALSFLQYKKRHKRLQTLMKTITLSTNGLPAAKDIIEQDYIDLISLVHETLVQTVSDFDGKTSEMTEYYTLWAHQIKTPIAAMRLLLQSEESGASQELLAELFKIEQYAQMVLHYLKLESINSDFAFSHCSLDDILKEVLRKYARQFILKKISLEFRETNQLVLTDKKWLSFVIEQLISNALKYTNEGTIFIYPHPDAPKTLVIEDTGIGIGEQDLPRIFERGFTGYNGHTDKRATGIGLYLCKQVLDKLSHSIAVFSKAGKGTTIYLDLKESGVEIE